MLVSSSGSGTMTASLHQEVQPMHDYRRLCILVLAAYALLVQGQGRLLTAKLNHTRLTSAICKIHATNHAGHLGCFNTGAHRQTQLTLLQPWQQQYRQAHPQTPGSWREARAGQRLRLLGQRYLGAACPWPPGRLLGGQDSCLLKQTNHASAS